MADSVDRLPRRPRGRPRGSRSAESLDTLGSAALDGSTLGLDTTESGDGSESAAGDELAGHRPGGRPVGASNGSRVPTAPGGWLFYVGKRLKNKSGLTDKRFPRQLASAVLRQSSTMSPLELVQALEKCQAMAIKATLLPSKGALESENPLQLARAMFDKQFNQEKPNGKTGGNQTVRAQPAEAGDGL